jgi:hypothetical protein
MLFKSKSYLVAFSLPIIYKSLHFRQHFHKKVLALSFLPASLFENMEICMVYLIVCICGVCKRFVKL